MSVSQAPTVWELVRLAPEPLLAGAALALMCSVLSVLVVVKRLGFIGQGISHSAFGGVGVAAMLAAVGVMSPGGVGEFGVVLAFCVTAALGMSAVERRRQTGLDAAIGLFLVASMALGGLLVHAAQRVAPRFGQPTDSRSWESILFGSIIVTDRRDVILGWIACVAVLGALWWWRRAVLFWAFDEETARAFGVPTRAVKSLVMVLLAVAVVTAMKLAGVVLATALLVLPGATALRLTDRLRPTIVIAIAVGASGILGGLGTSLLFDLQPGPCMVLVMTGLFSIAALAGLIRGRGQSVRGRGRREGNGRGAISTIEP